MADKYWTTSRGIREILTEECGVFGIYAVEPQSNLAHLTHLGLHALQHRGQESCGICVNQGGEFRLEKKMGLVSEAFTQEALEELSGKSALGHVRYSTTGASQLMNAQPLLVNSSKGSLALAHNGNLINSQQLKTDLENEGAVFHTTLDTEVIAHLVARSGQHDIIEALTYSLQQIKGGFSLVALTNDFLVAARDPHGIRPLSLGKLDGDYIVASESCAFTALGAELVRDIKPGELVLINQKGVQSFNYSQVLSSAFCIFEFIYFARPDSLLQGQNVYQVRQEMGRQLAQETTAVGDIVVPIPSSGKPAALGFAERAGLPYEEGIWRNKYIGRSFIQPTQERRDLKVRLKLSPIQEVIENQRVILVDDSIVRGTTSRRIVKLIKEAGAKEVHLAIASPPVIKPCYYGLDTSKQQELIAAEKSCDEVCAAIGADSLTYLSQSGLLQAVGGRADSFCLACLTGEYQLE